MPPSPQHFSTADLHDANEDLVAVCDAQFRSFGRRPCIAAPCVTFKVFEDHRLVRDHIAATPGDGRILVIDGGGSMRVGLLGDTMAERAMRNGWIGAIVFGVVRDTPALDALDFGVKALGTTARRGRLETGGLVDVPVMFGGVEFRSGWWVYADVDAVLVSREPLKTD